MGVDVSQVKCLGGDSTTLNTGVRNGIITQLERCWGHKVEWVTCLYHINELPMRRLLTVLDGKTKSPDSYTGNYYILELLALIFVTNICD